MSTDHIAAAREVAPPGGSVSPMRHPAVLTVAVTASATVTGALAGWAVVLLVGGDMPLWLTARASGIAGYLLLTLATMGGLLLSHPSRHRGAWVAPVTRLRLHIVVTVFALAFVALHVVVLAIDPWAQVGWWGVLLPMASGYRPLAVTLGVLSLWAGVIAGVSASLAGRGTGRWWLLVHRLAASVWVLAWLHGVLAGSDSAALLPLYVGSGIAVLLLAVWRYTASRNQPREVTSR